MNRQIRRLAIAAGVLMLVFGILCINYTKMGSVERHARFAQERGWPPPSRGIFHLGMLFAPLGGGLVGFDIGRRPHAS